MANEKISEMTYKQLAADDMIPSVNPTTDPTENYNFLGADIPLLVGVSVWDASATYAAGHIVIYNDSTIKGMFLVTTTTSAGDSPAGTGASKFKSVGLGYVANSHSASDNIGYERTGFITVSLTGATVDNFNISSSIVTDANSHKISATLYRSGTSFVSEDILIKSLGISAGSITFYVEKTTVGGLGNVRISYTIEG